MSKRLDQRIFQKAGYGKSGETSGREQEERGAVVVGLERLFGLTRSCQSRKIYVTMILGFIGTTAY